MSTTSPASGLGTPLHVSSESLHSFINQGVPNHYATSEQLDFDDEAIDVGDRVATKEGVAGHVTQRMKLSLSDESNEEASTAEEGRDSLPNYESTTTDNIMETLEPVDYIESNPRLTSSGVRYHANGALIGNHRNSTALSTYPEHRYENWSVVVQVDDGSKKSKL